MKYSYESLISFFKEIKLYDEEKFKQIERRTKIVPRSYEMNNFYGVFPKINKNGILEDFCICIPDFSDLNTYLINLKKIVQALQLTKNLNKKFEISCMDETYPKIIEEIYLTIHERSLPIKPYKDEDIITKKTDIKQVTK